ncbi:hypothetical protein N9B88_03855 [Rubripirellula sp.]|nr:hypothetical protein [Rubripirellula sp.]
MAKAARSLSKLFRAAGDAPIPKDKLDDLLKGFPYGARATIKSLAVTAPEIRVVATPDFFTFISKYPDLAPDAAGILQKLPSLECGRLLSKLSKESPRYSQQAVKHIASSFPEQTLGLLARCTSGRTVSNKQILAVIDEFRKIGDNGATAGDMFELIARSQMSFGTNSIRAGLKKGSRIIEGQYDSVHGIDGIGVALDGRPVLMEYTIDGSKNLKKTDQLSGTWCMTRWNKLVDENPKLGSELIKNGMDPSHWKKITADEALKWPRKLIAPDPRCLNETNRLAVGLDANDLILIGK